MASLTSWPKTSDIAEVRWWFTSFISAARKLRGYVARGLWPVLVAARNRRMAQKFRRQGVLLGVEVWSTAIGDLRVGDEQNVAGMGTVWTNELGERAT